MLIGEVVRRSKTKITRIKINIVRWSQVLGNTSHQLYGMSCARSFRRYQRLRTSRELILRSSERPTSPTELNTDTFKIYNENRDKDDATVTDDDRNNTYSKTRF